MFSSNPQMAGGGPPSLGSAPGLPNKYAGLLGFSGFLPGANGGLPFPGAPHHFLGQTLMGAVHNNNNNNNFSPSASPTLSDKAMSASPSPSLNENDDRSPSASPQPQDATEAHQKHIWDVHYEHAKANQVKNGETGATIDGLGLLSSAPQRSEGLAA